MANFYDTVIRNSKAFRSDQICHDMALLEPGTRSAVQAMLDEAKTRGIDLRLLETYRSQTRQSALFVKRATQLRTVGCHGWGVAADLGVFINGKYAENNRPYEFLRTLVRSFGLISGQDWGHAREGNFVDSGHVQRVPVWRQAVLFSGAWYPPEAYNPYQDSAGQHPDVVASLGVPAPILRPASKPFIAGRNTEITATVFGGSTEHEISAYTGHRIDDVILGVALPARLEGATRQVRVYSGGKSVVVPVLDVGPWNTNDPYWVLGKRPQAESGTDTRGRRTNRAGIDLTPALAKALGIEGKGVVDWEFI